MKLLMFHDDPPFWFETLRNLGLAAYGGSDVGEVIATASRVTPGDYDSWHDAWLSTAERLEAEERGSHPVSARDGLLRASSYYRAAEFFLHGHPEDPRIDHAYERGVSCFRDAIAHLPGVMPVEIPYEDTALHGPQPSTGTGRPSGRTGRTWSVPSWTSSPRTRVSIPPASRCSASVSAATSRPARPPTRRAWQPSSPSTVSSTPSPP
ncbi:hypothetical protein ACFWD7_36020 [Streptomyces mirabilis]|uniref:hypothetical protein n=1 Tax=Streptomyces mirabilis TaxID=68239 RepID=UPI0036BB68AA